MSAILGLKDPWYQKTGLVFNKNPFPAIGLFSFVCEPLGGFGKSIFVDSLLFVSSKEDYIGQFQVISSDLENDPKVKMPLEGYSMFGSIE
jgi:hypothetical protein